MDGAFQGYNPTSHGCTAPNCGDQETEWFSGFDGRRCKRHAPEFSIVRYLELHVAGFPGAALAYLRSAQEDVA